MPQDNSAPPTGISGPLLFNYSFAEATSPNNQAGPTATTGPLTPTPAPRRVQLPQDATPTMPTAPLPHTAPLLDQMETEDGGDGDNDDDPFSNGVSQSIHAPNASTENQYSPTTLVCPQTAGIPPSFTHTTPPQRNREHSRTFLAVAKANRALAAASSSFSTPLGSPQFTQPPPEGFPKIHLLHATQPLDHLNEDTFNAWFAINTEKVVLRVFNYDGRDYTNMNPLLTNQLCSAIDDIAALCTPDPTPFKISPPALGQGYLQGYPTCFLAYDLPQSVANAMTAQQVWSSDLITFEARSFWALFEGFPKLYFGLKGFTTPDADSVLATIQTTWDKRIHRNAIIAIIQANDPDFHGKEYTPHIDTNVTEVITHMQVEKINTKGPKGTPSPRFNILAGSPTTNPTAWTEIRKYLMELQYPSILDGVGLATSLIACQVCLSVAHPKGLCPFPLIPGWKGPKPDFTKSLNNFQRGRGRGYGQPGRT